MQDGKSVRGQPIVAPDFARIRREWLALRPAGGFRVILADPPWSFENRSPKGMQKNAAMHYDCMALQDIVNLPVPLLAADNAVLALWATWPLMPHWNTVITGWGFEFVGLLWEWIKYNPATGKYAFGPGYGTRKNLEPCLLATRGNPALRKNCPLFSGADEASGARSVRDFIEWWPLDGLRAPRREHSRKPDEARTRIETMFEGPYVELFARSNAPGWSSWGNETSKFAGDESE